MEVFPLPGLVNLADAAMEGRVLFPAEQLVAAEFLLQAADGLHRVLIGCMEAFRSCGVRYREVLIVIGVKGIKGIGIVTDEIEQIRCLVGSEEQFFAEDVLEQPHSLLEAFLDDGIWGDIDISLIELLKSLSSTIICCISRQVIVNIGFVRKLTPGFGRDTVITLKEPYEQQTFLITQERKKALLDLFES